MSYLPLNVNKNLRYRIFREQPFFGAMDKGHKKGRPQGRPIHSLKSSPNPPSNPAQKEQTSEFLLSGHVGDFNAPPALFNGLPARLGRWVPVTRPTVFQVIRGLVHRVMLPEFRLLRCSTTPNHKRTQKKQNQQLLHILFLLSFSVAN